MPDNRVALSTKLMMASSPLPVDMAYNEVYDPDYSNDKYQVFRGTRSIDSRTRVRLVASHLGLEVHVTQGEFYENAVKDSQGHGKPGATFTKLLLLAAEDSGTLHNILEDGCSIIAQNGITEGRYDLAASIRRLLVI
jgi:hypothetical protein